MTNHNGSTPRTEDDRSGEGDRRAFDKSMGLMLGAFVALFAAASYGAGTVSGQPWHTILVVLAGLVGLYALYLAAIFAAFVILIVASRRKRRVKAESGHAKAERGGLRVREGWRRRRSIWMWPSIAVVAVGWPIFGLIAGYNGSQWLWQGVSVYGGLLLIAVAVFRGPL